MCSGVDLGPFMLLEVQITRSNSQAGLTRCYAVEKMMDLKIKVIGLP